MTVIVSISSCVEPDEHPETKGVGFDLDVPLGLVVDHVGDAADADGFLAGKAEGAG